MDDPATIAEIAAERANGHVAVRADHEVQGRRRGVAAGTDELTPTMKIKCRSVVTKDAAQIEGLCAK
ncbi:hypothetical protein ACIO14_24555 [Nocardia fluminea]|uniref:hypothetical protein n=1 Tax=Nocardia fluminea TaxID=134984 RepID=UPI00380BF604